MSKKDKIKNIDMDDLKALPDVLDGRHQDRKSTRLNSSHIL